MRGCRGRAVAAAVLLLALGAGGGRPAGAATDPPASCWEQAGRYHAVDPRLLVAIAQVESGLRPAAIHRNGNGTVDLGLMQINSRWLPQLRRWGIRPRDLLDPCVSVHVAAWILAANLRSTADPWQAVGAYNAASAEGRRRYLARVRGVLRHLGWGSVQPRLAD